MLTIETDSGSVTLTGEESFSDVQAMLSAFYVIGSGVSRTVFEVDENLVLKQERNNDVAGGNRTEYECFHSVEQDERKFFAAPLIIADDDSWMLSERVEGVVGDLDPGEVSQNDVRAIDQISRRYGISDLHYFNVGYDSDGSLKMIDYAANGINGYGFSFGSSFNGCGCYECGCNVCEVFTCNCPTLEGCNETVCAACARRWNECNDMIKGYRRGDGGVWDGRARLASLPSAAIEHLRNQRWNLRDRQACTMRSDVALCVPCAADHDREHEDANLNLNAGQMALWGRMPDAFFAAIQWWRGGKVVIEAVGFGMIQCVPIGFLPMGRGRLLIHDEHTPCGFREVPAQNIHFFQPL